MKKLWNGFVLVWSLITRIRIPKIFMPEEMSLPTADAIITLPAVGALFGVLSVLPAAAVAMAIPRNGAAWIAAGIYTILGWSLHLDGWGDMWDGIGSGKRGDALRAVMKDTRVGAFGVAGIVLAIGARAALLSDIDPRHWIAAATISCGVGRFGANVAIYLGKYPWPEGMARDCVRNFDGRRLLCSLAVACLIIPVWPEAWAVGMLASSIGGATLALWASKNMGGVNGDVLGASAVLGEILTMAGCAALVR